MLWVLICYDISDDRIRLKFSSELEKFLDRVQKSVFEGKIRESDLEYIKNFASSLIDYRTDSVRIYRLCSSCSTSTETIGYTVFPISHFEDEVI